jgi:hypothetical protein
MTRISRTLSALALAACAVAAELPLGLVEAVDGDSVRVRFDAAARIQPGLMIGLHGPGAVTKHPLVGKVVTENRRLLAKGQVVAVQDGVVRLRVLWRDSQAQPEAGWDAVPLPGESAPNAPPALTGAIAPAQAPAGGAVAVRLPVADPDGDALVIAWELNGPPGRSGRLDARLGALPEVVWSAPALPPEGGATLRAVVRDRLGQEAELRVPLEVKGPEDPRRARKVFAGIGAGLEPAWVQLERSEDGGWIGVDDAGQVQRVAAGWQQAQAVAGAEAAVRRPLAVAVRGGEAFLLDADRGTVAVLGDKGQVRRSLGGLQEPRDLAVASDGSVLVADQRAGGVMVFDPSGRFRARAGRIGDDGFTEIGRLAVAADDSVAVLDPQARRVHRFDRELRRLDTWTVTGDPKNRPLDLAAHPRGLLVLLQDGSIQLYGPAGTVAETWKPVAGQPLGAGAGSALSLAAAPSGECIVLHSGGMAARLGPDGRLLGVRGPGLLRQATRFAADGSGRIAALDPDYGTILILDADGWITARVGGRAKDGGPFAEAGAMAFAPDGSALAVLDVSKRTVVRFDGRDWSKPPLVFGAEGSNNGQFKSVVSVALDEAGRAYVLDDSLYRVSAFDAGGQFLFAFGERGGNPHQLDEPVLVAVAPAGDAAWIFDEDRYEVKKFALDQSARAGRHAATGGGKGSDPGQFREAVAMSADRFGLLHVLDASRRDWQLVDFRGQSLLPLAARKTDEVLRGTTTMAVSPDGQVWLAGGGALAGLR